MRSLIHLNGVLILSTTTNLLYFEEKVDTGRDGRQRVVPRAIKTLDHGLDLENRVILGCAGGDAPSGRQVLVLFLSDKSIVLLWYPPGPDSFGSPCVFTMETATYRKASAAIISNGILFVADRFGSIYTHDLLDLEKLIEKQRNSPNKELKFILTEPVLGRCSTVTSLSASANGSVYFGDRDGILLETRADTPWDIRHIWSNHNAYIEQVAAWSRHGALSYGDFGLFYNYGSNGACQSQLLLENCIVDTQSGPTLRRCIGIACNESAAYVASLHIVAKEREKLYIAEKLAILKVDLSDGKATLAPLFTHPLELPMRSWKVDQPSLGELSRGEILQVYSVLPLQHSTSPFLNDAVPIFIDSLGTLFSCINGIITPYPGFLDTKLIVSSAHADPLIIEHASHRIKQ